MSVLKFSHCANSRFQPFLHILRNLCSLSEILTNCALFKLTWFLFSCVTIALLLPTSRMFCTFYLILICTPKAPLKWGCTYFFLSGKSTTYVSWAVGNYQMIRFVNDIMLKCFGMATNTISIWGELWTIVCHLTADNGGQPTHLSYCKGEEMRCPETSLIVDLVAVFWISHWCREIAIFPTRIKIVIWTDFHLQPKTLCGELETHFGTYNAQNTSTQK